MAHFEKPNPEIAGQLNEAQSTRAIGQAEAIANSAEPNGNPPKFSINVK